MTIRNLEYLLKPRSIALVGASTRPGSVGLITARNLQGWRLCGSRLAGQPQIPFDRGAGLLSVNRRAARRTRPRSPRHPAGNCPPAGRELGSRRGARRCRHNGRHSQGSQEPDAGGRAAKSAAHPGSQLPRPDAAAHRRSTPAFRTSRRWRATSRSCRNRARLITGHHRLGARPQHRLLACRLAGRHGRRRFRRHARLSRRRRAEPRHPALHGIRHQRAEVHVGGAARGALQTGHRRQGGTQREPAPRRRSRTRARWRAPMPPTRPRSGAPVCCACASSTSCSAPPRSWRGIPRSPATGWPSSPMAAARACWRRTGSATSAARSRTSPTRTRSALGCRAAADVVARQSGRHHRRCGPGKICGRAGGSARERRRRRHPGHELPDGAGLEHGRSPSGYRGGASDHGHGARNRRP